MLVELRATLSADGSAALTALHGMGGVGKTQLSLEYAYRYAKEYSAVLWVPSEEPAALASAYAGLAGKLCLPEQEESDQSLAIQAVLHWLESNRGWLLVFDNAPGPEDLGDYRPQRGSGHVVITSRNPNWRSVASPLEVEMFRREESVDFLVRRSGDPDREAAVELAEALGDLPLALEQAGAYVEQTGGALASYLALFQSRQAEVMALGKPYPDDQRTVATTWGISIEKLPQAAVDLLSLCAYLAPDDIPGDLISQWAEKLPQPLAKAAADPLQLDNALMAVRGYSLINAVGGGWSVHRLLQAVVRDRLGPEDGRMWTEAAVELVNAAFPGQANRDVVAWPVCARLLPHALAATGHAETANLAPASVSRLLNEAGIYLRVRARFADARRAYERALAIGESTLGPDDPIVAIGLNNLGTVLRELGDLEGARDHLQRALAIDEATYGSDHPEVAIDLNNLGNALSGLGDLEGARDHYQRALTITESSLGPDHPTVATRLNNLGTVLVDLRDLDGARGHVQRALAITEAALGPDHPDVATQLNTLGTVLHALGGPGRCPGPLPAGPGHHRGGSGSGPSRRCHPAQHPGHCPPAPGGPGRCPGPLPAGPADIPGPAGGGSPEYH